MYKYRGRLAAVVCATALLSACSSADPVSGPAPTQTSLPASSEPTATPSTTASEIVEAEPTELTYVVTCDTKDGYVDFASYQEAWPLVSDYCDAGQVSGPLTPDQAKGVELLEDKRPEDLKPAVLRGSLEYLVATCATSGKSLYGYLKTDGVDRTGQAEEVLAMIAFCPDHPDADEMTLRVEAILGDLEERGEFIYDGTYRVGKGVEPGTYVSERNDGEGCYWERVDSGGNTIDNGFSLGSRVQVTINAGDYEFISENCMPWRRA